ncbi:hypothetical protein I312_101651 [Cryptococcus bacillisporus CA1280]|uniref:uncharacterized protein n=1 Tax=Cryptococcus bacillisporus CA1280 TaxID=1296109 RepID=UPI003365DDF8
MGVSPPPSSNQDGRLPLTTAWTSTKQWAILLVVDFLLAAVSSALCLPAITDFKPVSIIAASTASVAFAWSVLRWRDVFGDVAMDILRRHASSQRWSVLGNRLEWDLSTDLRVRWLLQSGSRLCLGVGVGLGVYSIIALGFSGTGNFLKKLVGRLYH